MNQYTIKLTDAQALALDKLNIKTVADTQKFLEAGAANKIKSAVSSSLKSFVRGAMPTYNSLPSAMQKVMPAQDFLRAGSQELYDTLVSLGGREVKPLDELLAEILEEKE